MTGSFIDDEFLWKGINNTNLILLLQHIYDFRHY